MYTVTTILTFKSISIKHNEKKFQKISHVSIQLYKTVSNLPWPYETCLTRKIRIIHSSVFFSEHKTV